MNNKITKLGLEKNLLMNISLLENNYNFRLCPWCKKHINIPIKFIRVMPQLNNAKIKYLYGVCNKKKCLINLKKYSRKFKINLNKNLTIEYT